MSFFVISTEGEITQEVPQSKSPIFVDQQVRSFVPQDDIANVIIMETQSCHPEERRIAEETLQRNSTKKLHKENRQSLSISKCDPSSLRMTSQNSKIKKIPNSQLEFGISNIVI
jgi:hypothetical protein